MQVVDLLSEWEDTSRTIVDGEFKDTLKAIISVMPDWVTQQFGGDSLESLVEGLCVLLSQIQLSVYGQESLRFLWDELSIHRTSIEYSWSDYSGAEDDLGFNPMIDPSTGEIQVDQPIGLFVPFQALSLNSTYDFSKLVVTNTGHQPTDSDPVLGNTFQSDILAKITAKLATLGKKTKRYAQSGALGLILDLMYWGYQCFWSNPDGIGEGDQTFDVSTSLSGVYTLKYLQFINNVPTLRDTGYSDGSSSDNEDN